MAARTPGSATVRRTPRSTSGARESATPSGHSSQKPTKLDNAHAAAATAAASSRQPSSRVHKKAASAARRSWSEAPRVSARGSGSTRVRTLIG